MSRRIHRVAILLLLLLAVSVPVAAESVDHSVTRILPVVWKSAAEMAEAIQSRFGSGPVLVNQRENTLIVRGSEEDLKEIEAFLAGMDFPPREYMIDLIVVVPPNNQPVNTEIIRLALERGPGRNHETLERWQRDGKIQWWMSPKVMAVEGEVAAVEVLRIVPSMDQPYNPETEQRHGFSVRCGPMPKDANADGRFALPIHIDIWRMGEQLAGVDGEIALEPDVYTIRHFRADDTPGMAGMTDLLVLMKIDPVRDSLSSVTFDRQVPIPMDSRNVLYHVP